MSYRRQPLPTRPDFGPLQFRDGEPDTTGLPRDEIRLGGELYMERFYLSPDLNVRLHHICMSDPDRDLHDHPWDFVSVVLTGSYCETTEDGSATYSAPAVIARKAETLHRLTLLEGPMWTYVTTGPVRRRWGFATADGWVAWSEYERRLDPSRVWQVPRRKAGSNADGLERTIKAMATRLGEADEALVALARGLAAAVDAAPDNAALWREYRAAVTTLMEVGSEGDIDDDTEAFLLSIRTPVRAKVVNGKNA